MTKHYVYMLANTSPEHQKKTYVGYTVNPAHRIRQHNGELVGGAKYTKMNGSGTWEFLMIIAGFPNSQNALQCEWRLKHPTGRRRGKKYHGPHSKLEALIRATQEDRWTQQSNSLISKVNYTVYLNEKYFDKEKNNKLTKNFSVVYCTDLAHELDKFPVAPETCSNFVNTVSSEHNALAKSLDNHHCSDSDNIEC